MYFFLISFFSILVSWIQPVKAETATFYEAEYIDGIYMSKYNFTTKTTYYQKARFFRKNGTNEFAYCIEPFSFFNESQTYESTLTPNNLSQSQIDKISKIAHFGYGYKNHTDAKWYAITQMMIWQAADGSGNYYFTDTLNGNAISAYLVEMNEINNLINNYGILPSFANKTFTMVENHSIVLEDQNKVLNEFKSTDSNISIQNNQLTINNLKEGNYNFIMEKQENIYNEPYIFYQSNNSQNLIKTGNLNKLETKIKIKVIKTIIELSKIDKDTQSITPKGDAILDGAIFSLYNQNNKKIEDLIIKDNQAIIHNINFGKYYLKETKPGKGYTLNDNTYEIIVSENNSKISLVLENKVIEKKIIIKKEYGENNSFFKEKNITFNILNTQNEIIDTITTNEEGIAEITLPYGEYQIIQVNTTEGYSKVDPINITVTDNIEELIELKDYKIAVPNTKINQKNYLYYLLQILLFL